MCVASGVVEVVALLGSWARQGTAATRLGLGRSLTRSRQQLWIGLAQPRAAISAQRDVVPSLNADIAPMTEEFNSRVASS